MFSKVKSQILKTKTLVFENTILFFKFGLEFTCVF